MGLFDALNHLFNFLLPALAVAVLLALLLQLPFFKRLVTRPAKPWYRPVARNTLVGGVVLTAGLLWFGNDGKMATYLVLIASVALSQWWFNGR